MRGFASDPIERLDVVTCDTCGEDACTTRTVRINPWAYEDVSMCAECAHEHDNAEPREPDLSAVSAAERAESAYRERRG